MNIDRLAITNRVAGEILKKQMGIDSEMEDAVVEFFVKHPFPDDAEMHAFAEEKGYDKHQVEAAAYRLATFFAQLMKDGKANEKSYKKEDADSKQVEMGIKVELEHTPNRTVAERIVYDHLSEIPDYYTRLKKMEEDAGIKD